MKKNALRLLAGLLALVMVVSLAACGAKFDTVKAFLENPETKEELDKSIAAMAADDSMSVTLEGTDDTLIYNFRYSDEALANTDIEALKTALAEEMDKENFASTFKDIAKSVSQVVKVDNVKVKVVYAQADGTELASREYTK